MARFLYRVSLTFVNIFFPPLAVMMLAGADTDCLINCIFFLLAVIPSHIHGFYLSCTYFHRLKKVRAGRYPGGPKYLIASSYILNGGASNAEVARLYRKEYGVPDPDSEKQSSPHRGKRKGGSKRATQQGSQKTNANRNIAGRQSSKRTSQIRQLPMEGYQRPVSGVPSRTTSHASGHSTTSATPTGYGVSQTMTQNYGYAPQLPQRGGSQRSSGRHSYSPTSPQFSQTASVAGYGGGFAPRQTRRHDSYNVSVPLTAASTR
ncbi:MAG: hypothetical protein M1820_003197 [Bogoriella megaspora]|nr:MAG: hypothetical protein M1820_003197 [Bogoriella megaspora]